MPTTTPIKPGLLSLLFLLLFACAQAVFTQAAFAHPVFVNVGDPRGRFTAVSAPASVARYARWEATFQVANTDRNMQLPYEPKPAVYQASLFPAEDATQGISVDCLLLPPGQSDWTKAEDQPAFWFVGYDAQLEPTGEQDWHVRFAPNLAGIWRYRLKVRDAAGTAMTAPRAFTVTPSANPGFIRVSPRDSRYLEYSNGLPFLPTSLNTSVQADTPGTGLQSMASLAAAGATSLQRVWLGSNGGLNIIGGYANSGGRAGSSIPVALALRDAPPTGQRFVLQGAGDSISARNLIHGKSYTYTAWVRPTSPTAGHTYTVTLGGYASFTSYPRTVFTLSRRTSSGWYEVMVALPSSLTYNHAYSPGSQIFGLAMSDATAGVGGISFQYESSLTDDATGEPMLDTDMENWVTAYDQENSSLADAIVSAAETSAPEQYVSLECFQHEDAEWNEIYDFAPDMANQGMSQVYTAATSPYNDSALGGCSRLPAGDTYATVDTPILRFMRYFARYAMARWGYSAAVRGFEVVNEAPVQSPPSPSQSISQVVSAAFHANMSDHYPLMTSSYATGMQDDGGELDIADQHYYLDNGPDTGPFLPLDFSYGFNVRGNAYSSVGGPKGDGELIFSPRLPRDAGDNAPQWGDPGNMTANLIIPKTIQGKGEWTLSYQYKTGPDLHGRNVPGNEAVVNSSQQNEFFLYLMGDNPIFSDDFAGSGRFFMAPDPGSANAGGTGIVPADHVNGNNNVGNGNGVDYNPQAAWTTVSRQFTLPDNKPHPIRSIQFVAPVTQGNVYFSALRLTAPDGLDYIRNDFDRPLYNVDLADFAEGLGETLESESGAPNMDRPVDIGETDGYYAGDSALGGQSLLPQLTDVSITAGSRALNGSGSIASGYVGYPIAIPGAGPDGGLLFTSIAAIPGAGRLTLSLAASATVTAAQGVVAQVAETHARGGDFVALETAPYTFDAAGNAAKEAAWAEIGPAPLYLQWWDYFTNYERGVGAWKYNAAVHKFLGATRLSDGRWRNVQAVASAGIEVIGQQDMVKKNQAVLYLLNESANWDAIANRTAGRPVTGTVRLPNLREGAYGVTFCDTATGKPLRVQDITATGGAGLTIPVKTLAQDEAVRVIPAVSAHARVQPLIRSVVKRRK